MSTSSTEQAVESNTWTTRSKKEMLLGLVVTIANIGTEPIFSTLGNGLLLLSLLFIVIGVYITILGFLQRQ